MATKKRSESPNDRKGLELDDETRELLGASVDGPRYGRHATRGTRRDQGAVPAGHTFDKSAGTLARKPTVMADVTVEDVRLLRHVRNVLTWHLDPKDWPGLLAGNITEDVRSRVQISVEMLEHVRAFYRAVYGVSFGDEWQVLLAQQLRLHARVQNEQRLRKAHALKTDADAPPTPSEMLTRVRTRARDVPPALNARMIEALLPMVNLGGKGGRGRKGARTPEAAAAHLATRLRKLER
jgi:hypothetical protein